MAFWLQINFQDLQPIDGIFDIFYWKTKIGSFEYGLAFPFFYEHESFLMYSISRKALDGKAFLSAL